MDKLVLIQKAIEAAENKESNLIPIPGVLRIGGYTSDKIRHLLNNLGQLSKNYLEIGVHRGSTFVAANYGNNFQTSIAIDNFSEFDDGTVRQEFKNNCQRFNVNHSLLDQDCFSLMPTLEKQIDFYFYDGNHSYESQKKAVIHFIGAMTDEFIFCVDDYDWSDVHRGTQDAIKELGLTILFERRLTGPDWWNGIYVALIRKK